MKLSNLQVVPYGFELTRTLRTARGEMRMRRGFILSAVSHAGHRVHGEVAPLPGLSDESLREAAEVLETIVAGKLLEAKLANDSLDSIATFCAGLSVPPSVRHGVEQLFVDALMPHRRMPLHCVFALQRQQFSCEFCFSFRVPQHSPTLIKMCGGWFNVVQ